MTGLSIRLFGSLEISGATGSLAPLHNQASRTLLAFLSLGRGRLYDRDFVAGLLWGERSERSARKTLRNGLWRLRAALDPATSAEGGVVYAEGGQVGLLDRGAWTDTAEFEACTARQDRVGEGPLTTEGAERLERACDLYRDDLLRGFYDDWCVAPRERLRLTFMGALERLARYHRARGDLLSAIARARTLLRHDPLREHMHRELMELHYAMGDRPSALRQFRVCEKTLGEELDIGPMEETRRLRDVIARGDAVALDPASAGEAGAAYSTLSGGGLSGPGDPGPRRRGAVPGKLAQAVDGALSDLYALAGRLEELRNPRPPEKPGA